MKLQQDLKIWVSGYQELRKEFEKSQEQKKITDFLVKKSISQELSQQEISLSLSSVVDLVDEESDCGPSRRMHLSSSSDE